MYKTLWNHIKKNTKKHTTASVFLPVLVLGWTVIGLLAGALICPFLQAAVLVKATVVLCTGGYAGLIFGFFGGIFYIYRGTVKKSHTAVNSVPSISSDKTTKHTCKLPSVAAFLLPACQKEKPSVIPFYAHPNATSRTIISENPTAKKIVPIFECSPTDISGISSSTTT